MGYTGMSAVLIILPGAMTSDIMSLIMRTYLELWDMSHLRLFILAGTLVTYILLSYSVISVMGGYAIFMLGVVHSGTRANACLLPGTAGR